jgi:hypothetical protein
MHPLPLATAMLAPYILFDSVLSLDASESNLIKVQGVEIVGCDWFCAAQFELLELHNQNYALLSCSRRLELSFPACGTSRSSITRHRLLRFVVG